MIEDTIQAAVGVVQEGPDTAAAVEFWTRIPGVSTAVYWLQDHPVLATITGLSILFSLAWLALVVVRHYVLAAIGAILKRGTPSWWYELFFDRIVFRRLSWAVPLIILYNGVTLVPHLPDLVETLVRRLAASLLIVVAVRAFAGLLNTINEIYSRYPMAKDRPIKGLLQVISILAHLVGAILVIATLRDRSPVIFFSGLGAMSAILLLIFRDSILSLVAGIQITSNNLIRVGDWIEMPQFGADGDVVEIALNYVRVQNWDKTYTIIPTHKFLENSFKNWRGMQESGGRRIKRSVYIDMATIRFLSDEEIDRFSRFVLLSEYIARKKKELEEYNRIHCPDPSFVANARRLTNVGTLRAYLVNYLRQHPGINQDMTLLVRQLQPTPDGLPIEIYAFTNDTRWGVYEGIQSDIFDHILAIVPEFGLRVYQRPSGHDLAAAVRESRLEPA
ncbi:MAG TPA: mechanosensitive ion channel domain-containing protein [Longimicrobiales bacterium]|nr:mechanosensitive ion channel domain-containing protein [Longimicrobiales bacterium]